MASGQGAPAPGHATVWRGIAVSNPARTLVDVAAYLTLSRLERHFLYLLGENGLPPPQTNRSADGRRVDCRWPEHLLTVELDSYRYHRSRHAWERDEFRRYTYGDVFEDPELMPAELRALMPSARCSG